MADDDFAGGKEDFAGGEEDFAGGEVKGRGFGVEWEEKEMFNTGKRVTDFNSTDFSLKSIGVTIIADALLKAFCTEHGLTRGRTNHNYKTRVTYLNCNQDGCRG